MHLIQAFIKDTDYNWSKQVGQRAINRASESVDVIVAARSALVVARSSRERPDERILAQVKCNVGPTGSAITFSVENGEVEWLSEDPRTADEVLGNVLTGSVGRPDTQLQQAKEMLLELLKDGSVSQKRIMFSMKNADIGESMAKKAKAHLNIKSEKIGMMWVWSLPEHEIKTESLEDLLF